ncbi:MAG: sigma-70 family RNA polymerase sigma factor [Planctomycetes bacterium]|nr:sigma-70 family RNA polymerase sigma factor [Planctomycetota bacterium]
MPAFRQTRQGPSPDGEPPVADLVRRARLGDRAAFALLWRRYGPMAYAVILSVLPAVHAEDLLQEVALAALAALPSLRSDDGFAAWLCTIARNRARNASAALRRAPAAGDMDALPATTASVDVLEADEILATIRGLPATYREPLLLRFVAGLSGPEIGERLAMTPGSVRVNLCRGVKLLRARLAASYGAGT